MVVNYGPTERRIKQGIEDITEAAKQNPEEVTKLYRQFFPRLVGYCVNEGVDPENASDLAQDAFILAGPYFLESLITRPRVLPTLLYKICRNLISGFAGYQRRHKTFPLEDLNSLGTDDNDRDFDWRLIDSSSEARDPAEIVQERDEVSGIVERAKLTPLQRQVIKQRLLGFSYEEIASELGVSIESSRVSPI